MNKRLHPVSAGMFHLVCDMSINIQSKCSSRMTQVLLHGFYVVAALDRNDRVGMPQIVKSGTGKTQFCHHSLEAIIALSFGEGVCAYREVEETPQDQFYKLHHPIRSFFMKITKRKDS